MRLSTNTIHALGSRAMLEQQSRLADIGRQLSTGKRLHKPSDDPRAAAHLVERDQSSRIDAQYGAQRSSARNRLSAEESQLNRVTDALDQAKQLLLRAGTGSMGDLDRNALAAQLEGAYQQALAAANAKDGDGNYIFAGFKTDTVPFAGPQGALAYLGDNSAIELRVDSSRDMAVADSGTAVFASTTPGASHIATAGANSGTSTYRGLQVIDAAAADLGDSFELVFAVGGGGTTYSVVNHTSGQTLASGVPYTPGAAIALGDGLQVEIKGAPANGDSYGFARGAAGDSNILNALATAAAALRAPVDSEAAQARLTNAVNRGLRQVDNAMDNVLTVRATVGTRMRALDQLDDAGAVQAVMNAEYVSSLRDTDLVSAISSFTLAQTALNAAQQTFSTVQQLSLFSRS